MFFERQSWIGEWRLARGMGVIGGGKAGGSPDINTLSIDAYLSIAISLYDACLREAEAVFLSAHAWNVNSGKKHA